MPDSTTTALIAAGASLVVALISAVAAHRAQSRTLANQTELQRYQKDLKRLETELAERKAERDARRDYEYDALKRLYAECSPLVFALTEQAASLRDRIWSLAQAASAGDIGQGQDSWLTSERPRYYRLSTEYRIVAPLATFKLLQRRLTQLDLSLDPGMRLVYLLARQASRILSDDFALANREGYTLSYDPHSKDAAQRATVDPAVYTQQGIPSGILDNAVEALLVHETGSPARVASYMEFEKARRDKATAIGGAFARIEYLLVDFHPRDRPVLWRVLLAMASLHRAICLAADRDLLQLNPPSTQSLLLLPSSEVAVLDWRGKKDPSEVASSVAAAHEAVNAYLLHTLQKPVDQCLGSLVAMRGRHVT